MSSFLSGCIVGIIILQSAILAPTLFKTLEMKSASALLRALFPKFFTLLFVLGMALTAAVWMQEKAQISHYSICAMSVLSPLICRMIIPATNRAKDEGNESRFKLLHTVSVVFTLAVLFGNAALPFLG